MCSISCTFSGTYAFRVIVGSIQIPRPQNPRSFVMDLVARWPESWKWWFPREAALLGCINPSTDEQRHQGVCYVFQIFLEAIVQKRCFWHVGQQKDLVLIGGHRPSIRLFMYYMHEGPNSFLATSTIFEQEKNVIFLWLMGARFYFLIPK
jgi:hypothetical protein